MIILIIQTESVKCPLNVSLCDGRDNCHALRLDRLENNYVPEQLAVAPI